MYSRSLSQVPNLLTSWGAIKRLLKPRAMVAGDSFGVIGAKDQGTAYANGTELDHQFNAQGIINQARFLSMGALSGSFALSDFIAVGNTATPNHVANQLPVILAAKPQLVVWHAGTNDPLATNSDATAYTLAQTKAAVLTFVAATASIGALLVMFTIPPRGGATPAQRQAHAAINGFYRSLPQLYPHVVLVDYARYWTDHSTVNGDPIGGASGSLSGVTYDGTHPNARGAYIAGAMLWEALRPYVADRWPCETVGVSNLYDPILNPTGNLMGASADLLGTSGNVGSDTTVTGIIPSNFSVRNYANGLAVTCSKGAGTSRFGGGQFTTQRVAIGPSGTGPKQVYVQGPYVPVGSSGASIAIGDKLGCAAFVRHNNVAGLLAVQLGLVEYSASAIVQANMDGFPCSVSAGAYYPSAPYPVGQEGILEVPLLTVSSLVVTGVRLLVTAYVDAAATAVDFEFGAPNIWKMVA